MSNVINGNVPDTGLIKGSVHAIIGRDGYSAYQLAQKHGFEGTEEEWLLSLNGVDGTVEFDKLTAAQKESLRGEKGVPGVYIGSGNMPDGYSVQIDPNGDSFSADDVYHTGNKPTAADIGAVNKAGDTMKGALNVAANSSQTPFIITNTAAGTANIGTSAGGKYKYLAWLSTQNNTDDLYLSSNCTGPHHERKLIHSGDKPSGSYTGNGTGREIPIGGTGNLLFVRSGKGMALVTTGGCFAFSFANNTVSGAAVYYSSGNMVIADASANHEIFNAAGVTYSYQVL